MTEHTVHPRLVVEDAAAAINFYQAAFGGEELLRVAEPSGKVVQAEVRIGQNVIYLTEHDGQFNFSPSSVGGSPVLLTISVADADSVGQAFLANGGTEIIPIDDRPYGLREGRLQDPAGHLWIISQPL